MDGQIVSHQMDRQADGRICRWMDGWVGSQPVQGLLGTQSPLVVGGSAHRCCHSSTLVSEGLL